MKKNSKISLEVLFIVFFIIILGYSLVNIWNISYEYLTKKGVENYKNHILDTVKDAEKEDGLSTFTSQEIEIEFRTNDGLVCKIVCDFFSTNKEITKYQYAGVRRGVLEYFSKYQWKEVYKNFELHEKTVKEIIEMTIGNGINISSLTLIPVNHIKSKFRNEVNDLVRGYCSKITSKEWIENKSKHLENINNEVEKLYIEYYTKKNGKVL